MMEPPELPDAPARLKDGWAWAFRLGSLCLNLACLAAFYWMQGHFVTVDDYKADRRESEAQRAIILSQLNTINNTLTRIDTKMENDAARERDIRDHELRIRELEKSRYGKTP